jgi:exopolyphosphatase / guanosine-5'-triphosphate,3'-diphosphate pyrophosphatase
MELDSLFRRRPDRRPSPSDAGSVVGAVDAGSNALRAAVAVVSSSGGVHILNRLRMPVRLGCRVFRDEHLLETGVVERAIAAFERFRAMFDAHGASQIRAVGTSALREARDRDLLIDAVRRATGIVLDPIEAAEESRLVRTAVTRAFPVDQPPELVADLGGGSLELSVLYRGARVTSVVLPLGTVRLMETLGLDGPITSATAELVRGRVLRELRAAVPRPPDPGARIALCGGNARALARLVPGRPRLGMETLDVAALAALTPALASRTVEERIAAHAIEPDRAEVIAIAAVVIETFAEWAGAAMLIVPGVGVLDGLLHELAAFGRPLHIGR